MPELNIGSSRRALWAFLGGKKSLKWSYFVCISNHNKCKWLLFIWGFTILFCRERWKHYVCLSPLSALVRYPNGVVEHYYCAKGNLTRTEASPNNQPALSTSASQDPLNTPLGPSLGTPGMGLLAEATGMEWTPPPGLEDGFNQDWFDVEKPQRNRFMWL